MGVGFQPGSDFQYQNPYAQGGGYGGTSGGGNYLDQFLASGRASKGLFGLGDVATGGLLGMGQSLLGGIAGMFSGPSEGEKKLSQTYGLLQNKLGSDVLNPDQYLADYYRQNSERWGQQDEARASRVGMDSFLFANAARGERDRDALNYYGGMQSQADMLKSQQDMNILRQMAGIGASLG